MLRRTHRFPCLVLSLIAFAGALSATEPPRQLPAARLFPWATFAPDIPTQREVVGVEHGERPLTHAETMRFLEALAEASPRARLTTYSHSHEGRKLVWLAVSDEATIAGLDAFRAEHASRVDPRRRPAGEDSAVLASAKAVAWIAYGIHGDELSSVDAAAAMAYWLVAGEDARAQQLRRELVVLIDPIENPDGRDRYLAQIRSFAHKTDNPDTDDLSHTSVWPWGRGNHYLFDLNRDWFSMVQPESRRSTEIAAWSPQLVVDSHEMGAHDTYLFPPPRHPFNPLLPASHRQWWDRFAADQARALDARGYPYYTREWNEEFFPGYGSSWPAYHGALGILYEMSRTTGKLVKKRSGELRSYAQAVEHHVASSIANIETLAAHREEFLVDYVRQRRRAVRDGRQGALRAWLLPEGHRPDRTRKLVGLLRRQGLEVLRNTGRPPAISGLRDGRTGKAVPVADLPPVVWMIPLDQPSAPLARVLLDPHVPMQAPFFREEREHLERGKGTRLYETTAWSLPFSYDVEAYWTGESPGDGWTDTEVEPVRGAFEEADQAVGWIVDGRPDSTLPVLADLLQRGVHVRVLEKAVQVGGREYPRGSLMIKREGNAAELPSLLAGAAARRGATIDAVSTFKAERGPDLGGEHLLPLIEPRVGIWTGAPVSPSHYGALWHLLDEIVELRFSGLDVSGARDVDIDRYNVLVFPTTFGGPEAYRAIFGKAGLARLKRWIEDGGTAIGIGDGAEFLAGVDSEITQARLRREALDRYPPVVLGPGALEAQRAGLFHATGVRAPREETDEERDERRKELRAAAARRASPYDVAPLLGAGALPFVGGHEQGTPVDPAPLALVDWIEPLLPPGKSSPDAEDLARADERLRTFRSRGAFVRADIDTQLWLAWGLSERMPVLVNSADTLVAEPPVEVPARFAGIEELHLGGLLWPEAAGRLAHTAYATREGVGRGQVILFLSDPEFRGWTLGSRRMLLNAVLLGPGLGTRWSNPW